MKKTLFALATFSPIIVLAQSTGTVCTEQIIAGQRVVRCVSGTPTYSPRPEVQLPTLNTPVPIIQAPAPTPIPQIQNPTGGGGSYSPTATTPVQQQETIGSFLTDARKIVHPRNGYSAAISFNTGQKSSSMITTCANTSYRIPDYIIANISTVAGDFSGNTPNCYQENFGENINVSYYTRQTDVPGGRTDYCVLQPNTTYYFNIKFAYPDGRPGCGETDNCGLFVDFL